MLRVRLTILLFYTWSSASKFAKSNFFRGIISSARSLQWKVLLKICLCHLVFERVGANFSQKFPNKFTRLYTVLGSVYITFKGNIYSM